MWVGDISIDAGEQDLIDLFEECGKIEMICLQVNQLRNGQFGHVKFCDTDDVEKAAELAGSLVKGVPIRVDFAEDKPIAAYRVGKDRAAAESAKPEDCRTVWVGGLPDDVIELTIHELFGRCGEVREIRLDVSRRGGAPFCHIEYYHTDSVDHAIRLSGERLNGSKLRVDFADNRERNALPLPGPPGEPPPMGPPPMIPGMMPQYPGMMPQWGLGAPPWMAPAPPAEVRPALPPPVDGDAGDGGVDGVKEGEPPPQENFTLPRPRGPGALQGAAMFPPPGAPLALPLGGAPGYPQMRPPPGYYPPPWGFYGHPAPLGGQPGGTPSGPPGAPPERPPLRPSGCFPPPPWGDPRYYQRPPGPDGWGYRPPHPQFSSGAPPGGPQMGGSGDSPPTGGPCGAPGLGGPSGKPGGARSRSGSSYSSYSYSYSCSRSRSGKRK